MILNKIIASNLNSLETEIDKAITHASKIIVIAEDEVATLKIVARTLKSKYPKALILCFNNGKEALSFLNNDSPIKAATICRSTQKQKTDSSTPQILYQFVTGEINLKHNIEKIKMILTDFNMPILNGNEWINAINTMPQGCKVYCMTAKEGNLDGIKEKFTRTGETQSRLTHAFSKTIKIENTSKGVGENLLTAIKDVKAKAITLTTEVVKEVIEEIIEKVVKELITTTKKTHTSKILTRIAPVSPHILLQRSLSVGNSPEGRRRKPYCRTYTPPPHNIQSRPPKVL